MRLHSSLQFCACVCPVGDEIPVITLQFSVAWALGVGDGLEERKRGERGRITPNLGLGWENGEIDGKCVPGTEQS